MDAWIDDEVIFGGGLFMYDIWGQWIRIVGIRY